ncbi:hypothetical protein QN277_024100 [Acacia crassicarpa]|uniref:C2H2-type domain-containing protein n=1 Tax=Acacia crassicarpa TaxID=499986 RepID=A0AAE1JEI8_9FABA|nr:hypothetical protein QN277_024100 [Acacia crassicarpa]
MMKGLMFQQQQVVVEENMPNLTSASGEASVSSGNRNEIGTNYPPQQQYFASPSSTQPQKKRRNLPGNPDPDAEVIALSPKSLLATNRFICEICNKGFQRDQNLQLHRRGHNLPWKLKQRTNKEVRKKVYVCPEPTCVHHDPARALGDLTGIKKHFCRKHGEKKWKCDKCSKRYAVQSDWKAHSKTCGKREYRCDCGTLFSRRDSFITHRAFCDALADESARTNPLLHHPQPPPIISSSSPAPSHILNLQTHQDLHSLQLKKEHHHQQQQSFNLPPWLAPGPSSTINDLSSPPPPSSIFEQDFSQTSQGHQHENPNPTSTSLGPTHLLPPPPAYQTAPSPHMSATALLQKAAQMGSTITKTGSASASASASSNMIRTHHHTHVPLIPPHTHSSDPSAINSSSGNFGLNLSSHESAVLLSPPSATATASASSSFLLQDVMCSFSGTSGGGGFEGTSFEDAFGGILSSKNNKDGSFLDTLTKTTTIYAGHLSGAAATGNDGGGNEGLTRDFLGLTPLSHNEILSFAGIENCVNPTSHDHQKQSQKPWQG